MTVHTFSSKRAFTLVETLVAITVLTMAIVGPMYSIRTALVTSYTARDKLIATGLAQEAIEVVREIRDGNYLHSFHDAGSRPWTYGIPAVCISTNPNSTAFCSVDTSGPTIATCASGGCQPLTLSSNKIYTQDQNGTPTTFTRTMRIFERSDHEIDVIVTVSWTTNTIPYTITVTDTLYNWL